MKTLCMMLIAAGYTAIGTTVVAQVAMDSRGEEVIRAPHRSPPIFRTTAYEWVCVDPVRVLIRSTLRETGEIAIVDVRATIANIPVRSELLGELELLASKPLFSIYGMCEGDRPIASINYVDPLTEDDDGIATATLVGRSVYLRDPAPVRP